MSVKLQQWTKAAKRVWTRDETITMIEMYQQFPELWDVNNTEYKNRYRKNKCLKMIADQFGVDMEEVSRKIHNLRCQLNSEVRKIKRKKTIDHRETSWEFYPNLKFLIGLKNGMNDTVPSIDTSIPCEEDETTDGKLIICSVGGTDVYPMKQPSKRSTPKVKNNSLPINNIKRKKINIKKDETESLNKNLNISTKPNTEVEVPKNTASIPKMDDNCVFGDYVTTELRNLDLYHANKLKLKIRRAILEVTEEAFEDEHKRRSMNMQQNDVNLYQQNVPNIEVKVEKQDDDLIYPQDLY